jgi:hypothetical protein
MIGPASSHSVLWYAIGFEVAGILWYLAAVRRRLSRGEAGPALAARQAAAATPAP